MSSKKMIVTAACLVGALSVAGAQAAATKTLSVDINDRGAPGAGNTQTGFSEFIIGGVENNEITTDTTQSYGSLDVTIGHSNGLGIGDRRRSQPTNGGSFTQQELLRDFAFFRGGAEGLTGDGVDVLIEGLLPSSEVTVTVWSFDDGSTSTRVSDWFDNAGNLEINDYSFNGSADPTDNDDYSFSYTDLTNAQGELLIRGRSEAGSDPRVFLNALEVEYQVIPEPATATLGMLALGGLGVMTRRRRG